MNLFQILKAKSVLPTVLTDGFFAIAKALATTQELLPL